MKIFLIALLLGCASAIAQNKIAGIVSDSDQNPVSGVSIYIPDIQKGTIADSLGRYSISNIPNGRHQVTFSAVGYDELSKTIIVNGEMTLNVELESIAHPMDEVVVSTAFNKLQSQNVVKVDQVSAEMLRQKGAVTLVDGLSMMPGVNNLSTGISIGKPMIRGLTGNRVVVYAQGIRIENQQFGGEHGLGLNDSGIDNVEVIKGPASLLYGSDALGGVIYFNPEKFANANTIKADVNQQFDHNTLGTSTSAGIKGSTENWKFLLRGSHDEHSDYSVPDGKRVTNTRFKEDDIKAAVGYNSSVFSTVFRYNFNWLDTGIPDFGAEGESISKAPLDPRQEIATHILSVNNKFFLQKSSLETTIGYTLNDRKEFEDGIAALDMNLVTLNYDIRYNLPDFGRLETLVGIQGMAQQNRNFGDERLIPDATTDDLGVYGKINYEWDKNVLQAGLRFDNRNISSDRFGVPEDEGFFDAVDKSYNSFNASIGYKTTLSKFTLRMNLASGFRAPNLSELTSNGVHEGTNRYEIGNSALETENNLQADLDIEYKSGHFQFFVSGFYNNLQNYIYLNPTAEIIDETAVFRYAQDDAAIFGGEAGIHFHPHPLDFLHLESTFEMVRGKRGREFLPLMPADNITNSVRVESKSLKYIADAYARADIVSFFDQKNVSDFETRTGGYTLVNFGFGGKIKSNDSYVGFALNVNNAFNRRYVSHLSRLKQDGIPDIGRNIILSVNFNFE